MAEKKKKKELAILSILKKNDTPISSSLLAGELVELGHDISERTVRLYLKKLDEDGLTQRIGKRGRVITEKGLSEFDNARIIERVGYLSAKIDQMMYRMNFDLAAQSGTVVVNITIVSAKDAIACIDQITDVFKKGFAMGNMVTVLGPGERLDHITIPENMIGIGTVCSITLNGVLLKYGIPTYSRFGGLLELHNNLPVRFVEMINYDGTSIDPLEVFIRSGMTDYIGAINSGNGRIGASFREFPADGRPLVLELAQKLDQADLGAFMRIGHGGQALLEIPVGEGRVGAIVIGGLNPVAIFEETGIRVYSRAMSGLMDFNRLFRYESLKERVAAYL